MPVTDHDVCSCGGKMGNDRKKNNLHKVSARLLSSPRRGWLRNAGSITIMRRRPGGMATHNPVLFDRGATPTLFVRRNCGCVVAAAPNNADPAPERA